MIFLADLTVKLNAGREPNITFVTPDRPAPTMVTLRSPEVGPDLGLSTLTDGGGEPVPVISRMALFPLSATRRRPPGPTLTPAGSFSAAAVAGPPLPENPVLPLPAIV